MKKKVLSALLAVAMFVGLAVPAFASYSTQSGSDTDIKSMSFVKSEYSVANGDKVDLAAELRAYVSDKQLVQDPTIEWSIENDSKFAFTIDEDGKAYAVEDAGTATVIARGGDDSKIVAKTKVVAKKAAAEIKATGFQFKDNNVTLYTGTNLNAFESKDVADLVASTQNIEIVAYPKDAVFTAAQMDAIEDAFVAADFAVGGVEPTIVQDDNKLIVKYPNGVTAATISTTYPITLANAVKKGETFTIDGKKVTVESDAADAKAVAALFNKVETDNFTFATAEAVVTATVKPGHEGVAAPKVSTNSAAGTITVGNPTKAAATSGLASIAADKTDAKTFSLTVDKFPNAKDDNRTSKVRKSVTIGGKAAKMVTSLNAAGTITVEVGEKASTKDLFKQGPSAGNIKYTVSYATDYADQNASYDDYAVLTESNGDDASEIIGVAVGTNKITGTITLGDGSTKSASVLVKVVAKGTKVDAKEVKLSATTATLEVGGTQYITVSNVPENAEVKWAIDNDNATIVTGTNAVKIFAKKVGTAKVTCTVNGEEVGSIAVTVKAASTTTPSKPGATDNPQTGDSIFAGLF